jgi:nucleoside-diphosphate-sugar epimerase
MPHSSEAPHTDYERTKREADVKLEGLRRAGAPFVTLYPGVLYGPGEFTEANLVVQILRDHLRGKVPGLPGGGRARWSYALVDDVADAHADALDKGEPGARLALPGDNKTGREFFEEVERQTSVKPPALAIPIPVVWTVGALTEAWSSITGREPNLTRAEALTYAHDWALDGSLGAKVLGARATPLADGLRRTLDWLRGREPALFAGRR